MVKLKHSVGFPAYGVGFFCFWELNSSFIVEIGGLCCVIFHYGLRVSHIICYSLDGFGDRRLFGAKFRGYRGW